MLASVCYYAAIIVSSRVELPQVVVAIHRHAPSRNYELHRRNDDLHKHNALKFLDAQSLFPLKCSEASILALDYITVWPLTIHGQNMAASFETHFHDRLKFRYP